jgi:Ca2+/Na+ antiporter
MQSVDKSVIILTLVFAVPAQGIGAFSKMMPSSPPEGFTSSVLSRSLEAPVGIQLLSVSVLLLVFAVLATEQDDQTKADDKPQVRLLRADVFAFRLGLMACLSGMCKVLPASPREGLNPAAATIEVSEGILFLSLSVLFLIFAVVVSSSDADESEDSEEKPKVQLVKVDAIAFRSGLVACLLGLAAMRASFNGFAPIETEVGIPDGVQFLTVSLLLLVFAILILDSKEEEGTQEDRRQVELLRVEAVAFRLAMVAGLVGLAKILTTLKVAVDLAVQKGQEGYLLLAASVVLLVLATVLGHTSNSKEVEERQLEELKLKGQTQVLLVRPEIVAFRAAVMAGLTGLLKTTGSAEIPGVAISGEICMVFASAAAVAVCQGGL